MSKYFKNKLSYNHVFLLTVVAGYLLFIVSFYCLRQIYLDQDDSQANTITYLIELEQNTSVGQRNQINKTLNKNSEISELQLYPKEEALSYFNVNKILNQNIKEDNPFSDFYTLNIKQTDSLENIIHQINELQFVSKIDKVGNSNNESLESNTASQVSTKHYAFITILILIILSIVYIGLSLDFERNRNSLKKLLLDGAEVKFLIKNYQKKGLALSLKSWLLALFLFILTFYLLKSVFFEGNLNFTLWFWIILCLIPLCLIIFVTLFVINSKLKTITNT